MRPLLSLDDGGNVWAAEWCEEVEVGCGEDLVVVMERDEVGDSQEVYMDVDIGTKLSEPTMVTRAAVARGGAKTWEMKEDPEWRLGSNNLCQKHLLMMRFSSLSPLVACASTPRWRLRPK